MMQMSKLFMKTLAVVAFLPVGEGFHVGNIGRQLHNHQSHLDSDSTLRHSTPLTSWSTRTSASNVLEDETPYDWWRQWYPVALTRDLDSSVPTKVTLLNRDMVLWKEGGGGKERGSWRCFIDKCPHRLAPLSEGRIEKKTGNLQCAYHGWEWDGRGSCTKIPQLDPDAPNLAALASRRACAEALPTMEAQGMLWVWPDSTAEGWEASRTKSPNVMEGVDGDAMSYLAVTRDMPYGFDTLLENGIDPSHLPFAHHKIISNRNQAGFIDIKVDSISKEKGFDSAPFYPKRKRQQQGTSASSSSSTRTPPAPMLVPQSLHFRPPNLLYQVINVTEVLNKIPFLPKKERIIRIVTYAVPTAPGKSRVIYRFLRNYFLPPAFLRWPPQWWEHLRILRVLDSDTVFLHGQERELRLSGQSEEVDKAYYMPTPADGSVRALRMWVQRYGGPRWLVGKGDGTSLPPVERNRRLLLDRYHSHTANCKVCQGALRNLVRLRHSIGFLSVMAFSLGLLGQSVYNRLVGGSLTVLGLTGWLLVRRFEELFFYQEWNHGKNH